VSRAVGLIHIALVVLLGGSGACTTSPVITGPTETEAAKLTPTAFQPAGPTLTAITTSMTERSRQEPLSTLNQTQFLENLDAALNREDLAVIAQRIVTEINIRRAEAGLPALIMLDELNWIAFSRSNDMIARGYLSHIDPVDGSIPAWDMLAEANCAGRLVEHVFATPGSMDTVVWNTIRAWFGDSKHDLNLMDPHLKYTGIGVMDDGQWWKVTQVIAEDCP
jgi:uncharacterized protein YkwD